MCMAKKSIKLSDETKILLNKSKSRFLLEKPELTKHTDDMTINRALKLYLGGKK